MKKLYPMTDVERALAEEHVALVDRYLRRNRLPESEYYDVAIYKTAADNGFNAGGKAPALPKLLASALEAE